MTTPANRTSHTSIDPDTVVGLLSLTVADLERSVTFYTEALGFELLSRDAAGVTLGAAGTPLLILSERRGASAWPHDTYGYTGLYHFAILLPSREDLGRWLRHWLELGLPLPGQGDHLVSEALYLSDPDGNGIEIYRDRPRDQWQWSNNQVRMGTGPVDIRGLLHDAEQAGEPWSGLPAGTRLGHIHLQIGDVEQAANFYHEILGFDIVAAMPSALFISAGGYHHHIGLNTWHSRGADPAPEGTAGLRFFTIDFPNDAAREAVMGRIEAAGLPYRRGRDVIVLQDPWQNVLLLQTGSASSAATASDLSGAFTEATSTTPA